MFGIRLIRSMNGVVEVRFFKILFMILICFASVFFVSCSTREGVDMSTDRMAIDGLKQLLSNEDPNSLSSNGEAILLSSGQEISISTKIEHEIKEDDKWLSGIQINVMVDGYRQLEFSYGSIGVGESKVEARETAIDEWLEAFGRPFVFATLSSEKGIDLDGFTVFAGSTGFRGDYPGDWLNGSVDMHKRLLSILIPVLSMSDTFSYNGFSNQTLDLKININERGESSGECRLNGEVSLDILTTFMDQAWPLTDSSYLFKQYYIIVYNGAP